MAISFDYRVVQRVMRGTSGHESEELQDILDKQSKDGYRLVHAFKLNKTHQMLVFERDCRTA